MIYWAIKSQAGYEEIFPTKEEAQENKWLWKIKVKIVKVDITEVD